MQDNGSYESKNLFVCGTFVVTKSTLAVKLWTKGKPRLGCYVRFLTSKSTQIYSVPTCPQVKADEFQSTDYLAIHLWLSAVPPSLSFQLALRLLLLTFHLQDAQSRKGGQATGMS